MRVQRYLRSERGSKLKMYNNIFVKQFPRPDFSDEDLKVSSSILLILLIVSFLPLWRDLKCFGHAQPRRILFRFRFCLLQAS